MPKLYLVLNVSHQWWIQAPDLQQHIFRGLFRNVHSLRSEQIMKLHYHSPIVHVMMMSVLTLFNCLAILSCYMSICNMINITDLVRNSTRGHKPGESQEMRANQVPYHQLGMTSSLPLNHNAPLTLHLCQVVTSQIMSFKQFFSEGRHKGRNIRVLSLTSQELCLK